MVSSVLYYLRRQVSGGQAGEPSRPVSQTNACLYPPDCTHNSMPSGLVRVCSFFLLILLYVVIMLFITTSSLSFVPLITLPTCHASPPHRTVADPGPVGAPAGAATQPRQHHTTPEREARHRHRHCAATQTRKPPDPGKPSRDQPREDLPGWASPHLWSRQWRPQPPALHLHARRRSPPALLQHHGGAQAGSPHSSGFGGTGGRVRHYCGAQQATQACAQASRSLRAGGLPASISRAIHESDGEAARRTAHGLLEHALSPH